MTERGREGTHVTWYVREELDDIVHRRVLTTRFLCGVEAKERSDAWVM